MILGDTECSYELAYFLEHGEYPPYKEKVFKEFTLLDYDKEWANEQYIEWQLENDMDSLTNRHINVLFR